MAFCMSIFLLNPHSSMAESPAKTQSVVGSTNISIVLPDLIILHYYSGLTLNFEEFSSAEDRGSADFDVQWNGDAESASQLNDGNTEIDLPDRVSLQLPNVWAIRGLSPSGSAKVSISLNNNVLTSGPPELSLKKVKGTFK
ncbi:hypothetical protein OO006_07025 [Prosthecochloris sp. SCSIO W1101]|uniref:hypothetical protein n=1 Tax=Prosthecochloris sp. SCSIO W1101 TaxID=2992242 RepID=UPI00223E0C7F|nr:hypothetical protein [Prosthecochloris sp. SCSIO W1101]UZJ42691.1 hypothetical protein OO006_07025 [Prosthecochloris sp. SCSIO W1101]